MHEVKVQIQIPALSLHHPNSIPKAFVDKRKDFAHQSSKSSPGIARISLVIKCQIHIISSQCIYSILRIEVHILITFICLRVIVIA